jgi:NitT/TauT family transport system substrate-binding protein
MAVTRREIGLLAIGATPLILGGRVLAQGKASVPIEKMKVTAGNVPSFVYGGFYVALERGYFAERGLDVELVPTRGGDTAFQIAGNTLQFAGGSPDSAFFNGLKRGLPLMAIGSLAINSTTKSSNLLMVRKDLYDSGTITKVEQLKGRKVSNLVPGGITEYLLALHLKVGGLTMDDVEVVSPLGFAQMVDGLTTKAIDAALLAEPFATMATKRGVAEMLDDKGDLGEQILWIQANQEFAKQNPNIVTNFLIAYLKAARDIEKETFTGPKVMEVIEKYTKIPADIIKAAAPPTIPPNGEMNVKSIMDQQRYHMSRGKLTYTDLIPTDQFINLTFLNRALDFLSKA